MIKLSVIIPVYNTQEYLERCLKSVVNQTLKEIEIIILNDGSTDESEKIILEYCNNDNRIKYYKHNNIGLGPTRNIGIEKANGKYIAFVDSDDFVDLSMFEKLYDKAIKNNSDIVCCELYLYKNNNDKKIRKEFDDNIDIELKLENLENFFRDYYFGKIYSYNACDKIYKSSLLKNKNIMFGDNKKIFSEDNYFQLRVLQFAQKISFLNIPLYYYYIRSTSIMNSYKNDLMKMNLKMGEEFIEFAKISKDEKLMNKIMANNVFNWIIESTINNLNDNKFADKLKIDINTLKRSMVYNMYINNMFKNKSYLLEPNKYRRYFMIIIAYLLKYNLDFLAIKLLYFKYK